MNDTGLGLILVGLLFMAAEAFLPSFGALGLAGLLAFGTGWIFLLGNGFSGLQDAWLPLFTIAVVAVLAIYMAAKLALRARQRPVVTGVEGLVGGEAEALEDFIGEGWVHADGETWQARSTQAVRKGDRLRITALHGLTLSVEPIRDAASLS